MMKMAAVANIRKALTINPHDTKSNRQAAVFVTCFAIALLAVMPEMAMAAVWDSVGSKVLSIFTGGLTRTIAIIAVIALGISALAGKLSWDWAIKIVVGIVLIFGGAALVDFIISAAS
jgi:type IV secretory pathway VirB2 component (pilin)